MLPTTSWMEVAGVLLHVGDTLALGCSCFKMRSCSRDVGRYQVNLTRNVLQVEIDAEVEVEVEVE